MSTSSSTSYDDESTERTGTTASFDRGSIPRPAFEPERVINELLRREKGSEKFIVDQKVGQGGMGAIFKVYDQDLKRFTVLKVILPGVMQDRLLFRRFIEEAQITGQLEHPNIVPVHELGVLGDAKLYFSMKFVEGEALGSILRKVRDGHPDYLDRYSRYTLLTIFRKVCDAIAFAHSRNIIHRDIKPDNVMVGDYGEVLLMDWGLARPRDRHNSDEASEEPAPAITSDDELKTQYGVVKGTPAYMSPEQAKGSVAEIDHRSDIYLLGATLYVMVTFQVPFTGRDIYDILENAENGNFIPPGERAPEREIPDELCRIIMKAMAYKPEDRYQTVETLCHDLDDLMAGNTVSVRKMFHAGEYIMREGEAGYEAYVIITGKVEVLKTLRGKFVQLITLLGGDVIGEMALILQAPRSATVRALEDTEVVIITEETMKQGLGQLPPWMGKIVDSLAERVRKASANVHPLMSENCSYHVLNQLRLIYTYWSRPKLDPETQQLVAAIPTNRAIQEIATNLSITKERVALLISHLMDSGLLRPIHKDEFFVPSLDLLSQFIDHIKRQLAIESGFEDKRNSCLFIADDTLVVRHSSTTVLAAPGTLIPVVPRAAETIIGVSVPDETTKTFDKWSDSLRELLENFAPASSKSGEKV